MPRTSSIHIERNGNKAKVANCKILHFNIKSLLNATNLTQRKEFVHETILEVFTLSETWLNSTITNVEISIEGYTSFRQDRLHERGGGVCSYIRNVSLKRKEISFVS